jgi:HNH endonuclease
MRHTECAGGIRHMEIDHFDPHLKGMARDAYSNLMLATRHCNNMKNDDAPFAHTLGSGTRLLNPTKEADYGHHIFEDPKTHELVGTTAVGKYHIDILDLNHETFVWERRKRALYLTICGGSPITVLGSFDRLQQSLKLLHDQFALLIPYIPPPPAGAGISAK